MRSKLYIRYRYYRYLTLMTLIRLLTRCVYCKACGRYRLYKQRDDLCVCGSNWYRVEDDHWGFKDWPPFRWEKSHERW